MGKYNFDRVINRKHTNASKLESLSKNYGADDLIPLWVADMDFAAPIEVQEVIQKTASQEVFGYTVTPDSYYDSIVQWLEDKHDWKVDKDWIDYVPGVVKGISFIMDCFVKEGEKAIIQPPVYPPFRAVPARYGIQVLDNPLQIKNGKFQMDLEGLQNIIEPSCRFLILCNPHNPGGTVWTKKELVELAEICYENGILVISDEIHCDLALYDNKHIPFSTVSDKAAQNSITLMAPSKTFNIAGIVSSFFVIPNDLLRSKFKTYLEARDLHSPHMFAPAATEAAYKFGGEWLEEVKVYIEENINFVEKYAKEHLPRIKTMRPQASFLIWLDCRSLELSQQELVDFFVKDAKLALNDGASFGKEGEGYMRLNIASPRSVLEKALDNLKKAYTKKQF